MTQALTRIAFSKHVFKWNRIKVLMIFLDQDLTSL
jgi:hypothetical protein